MDPRRHPPLKTVKALYALQAKKAWDGGKEEELPDGAPPLLKFVEEGNRAEQGIREAGIPLPERAGNQRNPSPRIVHYSGFEIEDLRARIRSFYSGSHYREFRWKSSAPGFTYTIRVGPSTKSEPKRTGLGPKTQGYSSKSTEILPSVKDLFLCSSSFHKRYFGTEIAFLHTEISSLRAKTQGYISHNEF